MFLPLLVIDSLSFSVHSSNEVGSVTTGQHRMAGRGGEGPDSGSKPLERGLDGTPCHRHSLTAGQEAAGSSPAAPTSCAFVVL